MFESAWGEVFNSFTKWLIDQHIKITERHEEEKEQFHLKSKINKSIRFCLWCNAVCQTDSLENH